MDDDRYRLIVDASVDFAIFHLGHDGVIQSWNPGAQRIFGFTSDEIVGRHGSILFVPEDVFRGEPEREMKFASETGRAQASRWHLRKDGSRFWADGVMLGLRDQSGTLCGLAKIVRDDSEGSDVSEQKRVEEALREKDEAFRQAQKLESIGVLAGGIAHDFNNLLTGIMGNAGLARRAVLAGRYERAADMLQDVLKASERAADLTRQLLAYAGKGQFVIEPLDVCKLVTEVSALIRASISKKITLVLDVPDECPPIEGDRTQLQQLVMNLVINGGEAIGDQGGTLTVRIRTEHFTERRGRLRTAGFPIFPGEYVRIDVIDSGEGMDKETRDRIFEPFFTTKFLGRGLGLSAALGIVRSHRGAIGVLSEPEKGTTFTVLLPALHEPQHLRGSGPELCQERDYRGVGTVLVADDDQGVRTLAASVLYEAGYTVELAEDGVEAVERLRELGPKVSLVLLDLSMPKLGGAEAALELRRIRPDIPIVVMSGYGDVEVMERFSGARIDDYLPKPFSPDQLAAKVRDVLAPVAD